MDRDTALTRYIGLPWFKKILNSGSLFLPIAVTYETSDINEGRFTDDFVERLDGIYTYDHMASAIRDVKTKEEFNRKMEEIDYEEVDERLLLSLAWIMAAREESYISCWTYREEEDDHMWSYFGQDHTGVALRSTIRKVDLSLESVYDPYSFDDADNVNLRSNEIIYSRQEMHDWLDSDNKDDHLLPLFFLDSKTYENEQEYRFVVNNYVETTECAAEKMATGDIKLAGSYKSSFNYRNRKTTRPPKGIHVKVDLNYMLDEVIFGKNTPIAEIKKIERLMKRKKLDFSLRQAT